jgi:uncharacterized protein YegJ (DUF2314 family)
VRRLAEGGGARRSARFAVRAAGPAGSLCILAILACAPADSGRAIHSVSEAGDTTYYVDPDDADLRRAKARALCTLPEFLRRLRDPRPGQSELMLKGTIRAAGQTEHLWMTPLEATGDSAFVAVVENDPAAIPGLSYGDTVVIHRADVADWYAVERDTLIAGFTMRVFATG